MILLLLAIVVATSFVSLVHFIVRPLVRTTYEFYEPLWFHYSYKLRTTCKKTLENVKKKSLKSYHKIKYFRK
jgi:hypothetical protein